MTGKEYMILSACLAGQTIANFAAPIGLNRLLKSVIMACANDWLLFIIASSYLETSGANAIIQPWFWILWLLAGPIVRSICFHWYLFISTRTLVRTEGLLTQLVFEHSFRIRLKAGASDPSKASMAVCPNSSSDSQPTSKARVNGKDKGDSSTFKGDVKQASKSKKDADNLIGKINNLVTTDLSNIVEGRDFLIISTLQAFCLCA